MEPVPLKREYARKCLPTLCNLKLKMGVWKSFILYVSHILYWNTSRCEYIARQNGHSQFRQVCTFLSEMPDTVHFGYGFKYTNEEQMLNVTKEFFDTAHCHGNQLPESDRTEWVCNKSFRFFVHALFSHYSSLSPSFFSSLSLFFSPLPLSRSLSFSFFFVLLYRYHDKRETHLYAVWRTDFILSVDIYPSQSQFCIFIRS